jgi:hypothetical protein
MSSAANRECCPICLGKSLPKSFQDYFTLQYILPETDEDIKNSIGNWQGV